VSKDTVKLVAALQSEFKKYQNKQKAKLQGGESLGSVVVPTECKVKCTIYEDKPMSMTAGGDSDIPVVPKSAEELSYNTTWMNQHVEAWEQAYSDPEMWAWLFTQ